jgi:arsenate reductase (glutaredoxin)
MVKIFHNSRCKYSRAGFDFLKSKTDNFKVREYLKEPITKDEIKEILLKTNLKPIDLVRTQEEYFKKNLKGRNFNTDEWITIMIENPKIIKRPIVVGRLRAVVGIPPEEIDRVLKE